MPRGWRLWPTLLPALLLACGPVLAQQPRPLFPPTLPEAVRPEPIPTPGLPPDRIEVAPLPPPAPAAVGLAWAEDALNGPLWDRGAPADLPLLLKALPAEITEPTLRELQRTLLAAPAPVEPGGRELLLVRVDRLLAMAEPEAALDLLASVPGEPGLKDRRLLAGFAADRNEAACAAAAAESSAAWPWPEARTLCAALAGDARAVELGLDLLAAGGRPPDPTFAALARALAQDGRAALATPVADDPLLLPLLRRAALEVNPARVAALPPPVRRALLANDRVPSAVRAAAAPSRPGPSARPELNGSPPTDWLATARGVAPEQRESWAALVDGLGLELPEAAWTEVWRARAAAEPAPAPDLYLWHGFEVARAREQRGAVLLHVLLLLDGRPEAAAPVTLRRSLDALVGLDLAPLARALAAGTGGTLGL